MPQIVVEGLVKTFSVAERKAGVWGALRGVVRRRYREVRARHEVLELFVENPPIEEIIARLYAGKNE